jgi:hypothetical protein
MSGARSDFFSTLLEQRPARRRWTWPAAGAGEKANRYRSANFDNQFFANSEEGRMVPLRTALVSALSAALLAPLAACHRQTASDRTEPGDLLATTDPQLALGNLDAQIEGQEQLLARQPQAVDALAALVELLQARAQVLGRLSDLDRVEELGERAVRELPGSAEASLVRAQSRAALHRFDEALADATRAEQLGLEPQRLAGLRASVLQARGLLAEALPLWRAQAARAPGIRTLGALAAAEGAAGDTDAARGHFAAAVASYRDTSPLPLCWIDFQRGLLAERRGELAEAAARYRRVLLRLPHHAPAAAHLAGLLAVQGEGRAAEALLRPLLAQSDDPEYPGQLAALLEARGEPGEARRLRERAAAGYEALLGQHPAAFADHAARFWLPLDPARALPLAVQSAALRPTWESYDLALSAAVAARDPAAGCALAGRLSGRSGAPRRIELLEARACP